ncbi:hypothetical protein GGP70_002951 [Salinibacter ruber]|nr:hypothetical protein [Salinibacter ruber]MCS3642248.1 hypothetical protein [Salinibacter ruber]
MAVEELQLLSDLEPFHRDLHLCYLLVERANQVLTVLMASENDYLIVCGEKATERFQNTFGLLSPPGSRKVVEGLVVGLDNLIWRQGPVLCGQDTPGIAPGPGVGARLPKPVEVVELLGLGKIFPF